MKLSGWKDRLASLGIVGRCLLLALALVVMLAIVFPLAVLLVGSVSGWAALTAALVVWIASVSALALGEAFHGTGPNAALLKVLFGMTLRMALPLAACVGVHLSSGPLDAAGFVFYVLGFYLLMLPIDTMLSVTGITQKTTGQ